MADATSLLPAPPEATVKGLPPGKHIAPLSPGGWDSAPPIPLPNADSAAGPIEQGVTAFGSQLINNAASIPKNLAQSYAKRNQPIKDQLKDASNVLTFRPEYEGSPSASIEAGEQAANVLLPPQPIAAEHPSVAAAALDEHSRNGYSVFDPRTGESLAGARKWSVPMVPEATQISEKPPTIDDYAHFAGTHRELFARTPNAQIGTHFDPDSGLHYTNIVGTTSSKTGAMAAANSLGEKGIFHLGRSEAVPADNAGNRPPVIPGSLDDRFSLLHSSEPPSEPFSGVHYSDAKMDYIDGGRRGQVDQRLSAGKNGPPPVPAGAESARVRLGSANGVSDADAPPGFYVYKQGSLPDPSIGARKYAHSVQGNFSFANIKSEPEWQKGLQDGHQKALAAGADPQTAAGIALNSAEHSLRDAGFDGYYNPDLPNTRFIFDSHPTAALGAKTSAQTAGGKLAADSGIAKQKAAMSAASAKPAGVSSPSPSVDPTDPAGLLEAGEMHRNALQ